MSMNCMSSMGSTRVGSNRVGSYRVGNYRVGYYRVGSMAECKSTVISIFLSNWDMRSVKD